MKTIITTSVSISTQQFDSEGDVVGLVPTISTHKEEFDTEAQAECYREEVDIWLRELPEPSTDIHPFPKRKIAPTEKELFRLLDEIHGDDDLWEANSDNLEVPAFVNGGNGA